MGVQQEITEAAKCVAEQAKDVTIDESQINPALSKITIRESESWSGNTGVTYERFSSEELIRYFVLRESLNFCFWDSKTKWKIQHNGSWHSGSYGLLYALEQALTRNQNLLDPDYLSQLSLAEFNEIFAGTTTIPLATERYDIVKNLANEFKAAGQLTKLFDVGNDEELLARIIDNFQNFRDTSQYDGHEVYFYKRAILLVTDLINHVQPIREKIHNNDSMPGCADYKASQSLRQLGILKYSPALADKIDNRIQIEHGSEPEIEIRAATLVAIELIKQALLKKGETVNSVQIDNALWLLSKQPKFKEKPYHLTRTIYY